MHVIHHAQLKTSCSLSKEDMDISMLQHILFLSAQSAVICLQSVAPCQLPSLEPQQVVLSRAY